jgi:hypothetical protein
MPTSSLVAALAAASLLATAASAFAEPATMACKAESGSRRTPVIELYTSEGCSSCPPADRWLSSLKGAAASGQAVVQAFHVGYWDYIGWVDRFAAPAHTQRQRQVAAHNGLRNIYTPQVVRNGRDWRDWSRALGTEEPAAARIAIRQAAVDAIEASVEPLAGAGAWSAYWTVTEHGHSSKVKAGENAGELLQHDFVVRQYVPLGTYQGAQQLRLRPVPAQAGYPRQVNLVVFDARDGKPLQALGVGC